MYRVTLFSAAGLAAAALATTASAAPVSAPSNGKAIILIPLKLTKVQDLDFGTVVSSASSGTVTIDATSGARSSSGGVTEVTSAPGAAAQFDFAGTANQQVNFSISSTPATLDDGVGDSITVSALTLSTTTATVDPTTLTVQVGVGGTVTVAANQPDGLYSNTFDVTADYN